MGRAISTISDFFQSRSANVLAWTLWFVLWGVVSTLAIMQPTKKTVTPVYRQAIADWHQSADMYETATPDRLLYHYPPHFAVLYMPITWFSLPVGEALWRALCIAVFSWGLWRLAHLPGTQPLRPYFLTMTGLSVWVAMTSARNGQLNLLLAGLMVHTAVDLALQRWWSASLWMGLGLVTKPIVLVMVLLAAVFYRPIWWRLAVVVAGLGVLPFLFASPSYVIDQFTRMFTHVYEMRTIQESWFCNLKGMLRCMGIELAHSTLTIVQLVSALATLGICWIGYRLWAKEERTVYLLLMASLYLMLFNPITETNSYVILIPAVSLLASWRLWRDSNRWSAAWLLFVGIGIGSDNLGNPIHGWTDLWFKCALAVGMVAYVLIELSLSPRRKTSDQKAAQPRSMLSLSS